MIFKNLKNLLYLDTIRINNIYLSFEGENFDWSYEDEELFLLKGFSLEIEPSIYHYNHLWNELVFENLMKFPSSTSLHTIDQYPWTLKKLFYFHVSGDMDKLLKEIHKDIDNEEYIYEIGNHTYFPLTYDFDSDISNADKLIFFINTGVSIHPKESDYIIDSGKYIKNEIYGSPGSFLIVPNALLMGFSNYLYFSFDEKKLNEYVEIYSTLAYEDLICVEPPEGISVGHYSKSLQNGVNFDVISKYFDNYNDSLSIDEIYVSRGFLKSLGYEENPINQSIFLSYQINENQYGSGGLVREYSSTKVVIKGIVESEKNCIYQTSDWLLTFFQCRLGVSSFALQVNSIAFDLIDNNKCEETIKYLNRDFPQFETVNPFSSINESVDDVCKKLELAVSLFSVISIIISAILLAVCNFLHILETKEDIGLSRCIGITKYESLKFLLSHSLIMCLISFVLSAFEILLVSLVTCGSVSNVLGTSFSFSFNPMALLIMFVLSITLSVLTSIIVAIPFLKLTPLDQLKH